MFKTEDLKRACLKSDDSKMLFFMRWKPHLYILLSDSLIGILIHELELESYGKATICTLTHSLCTPHIVVTESIILSMFSDCCNCFVL